MQIKSILLRSIHYLLHGIPTVKIYPIVDVVSSENILKGRHALITGGTSGIGYEIAKSFVKSGAKVVITGRNFQKLEEACRNLNMEVGKISVQGILMDNNCIEQFPKCISDAIAFLGCIDILVNNAGIGGGDFKKTTEEEYDLVMNTNLKSVFFFISPCD